MSDAIPSDHPTIESVRVECSRVGRTGRLQILLPPEIDLEDGDLVELTIDGERTHARVGSTIDGEATIESAYANRRLARTGEGTNLLAEWFDTGSHGPGSTLVVDEVTAGYAYGLREPGSRVTYEPAEPPDASLADIAESLDG